MEFSELPIRFRIAENTFKRGVIVLLGLYFKVKSPTLERYAGTVVGHQFKAYFRQIWLDRTNNSVVRSDHRLPFLVNFPVAAS